MYKKMLPENHIVVFQEIENPELASKRYDHAWITTYLCSSTHGKITTALFFLSIRIGNCQPAIRPFSTRYYRGLFKMINAYVSLFLLWVRIIFLI